MTTGSTDITLPFGPTLQLRNASKDSFDELSSRFGSAEIGPLQPHAVADIVVTFGTIQRPSTAAAIGDSLIAQDCTLVASSGKSKRTSIKYWDGIWNITTDAPPDRIPMLDELVKLKAIEYNSLPLHACAVAKKGLATLALGAAHGGKTGFLLTQLLSGASFLSDDFACVRVAAGSVCGSGSQIGIKHRYLRQRPELARMLSWGERNSIRVERLIRHLAKLVSHLPSPNKIQAKLKRTGNAEVERAYDVERVLSKDRIVASAEVERAFVLIPDTESGVRIETETPQMLCQRIQALTWEELAPLRALTDQRRVATGRSGWIDWESCANRLGRLVRQFVDKHQISVLKFPAPLNIVELETALVRDKSNSNVGRPDSGSGQDEGKTPNSTILN